MSIFFILLLVFVVSAVLTFTQARLWAWTLAAAGILFIATAGLSIGPVSSSILWAGFITLALVLNVTSVRKFLLSRHLLKLFRKVTPVMSQTERDALEAGTIWWDAELFSGQPDWDKLNSYKKAELSNDERAFLDGPVEVLCSMLNDWDITHKHHDLPKEVWSFLKDQGFFGMIIPKKYGGKEFSALAHSSVVMKIASRSITAAVTTMVPNSLGPAELLLHYGTNEQKDYYLPRLARGDEIPCFALTGPDAGSDAGAMTDSGIVEYGEYKGERVLGIRLNWQKRYITLGPVATLLGLAFKLYDPEHLLGDEENIGITLALIPTDTPGIEIGERHLPMNIPFQNGPNKGDNVFIPLDWVIGGKANIGCGWRMLMDCLAAGRSISLPALSTGAGKLASRATGAYARIRRQFNMPIGRFEGVEEALTRITGYTYMMDAARKLTTVALDSGEKPSVISAIMKYHTTEMMRTLINDAMDIQGGSGICLGPQNLIGRVYQALPIAITVEGANILTRSMIIFGQGALRCHPYIFEEMSAVNEKDQRKAEKIFDHAIFGHVGFFMQNLLRSLLLLLTDARLLRAPGKSRSKRVMQHLTRLSSAFTLCADLAILGLGGQLKRKEKLSARLGDVLSHLYLASAVVKQFRENGENPDEEALFEWSSQYCLYHIENSLLELARNYPHRPLGWLMKLCVAPVLRRYALPSDKQGHKISHHVMHPSMIRDQLTQDIFIPHNDSDALGRIEDALYKVIMAEEVEKKVRRAVKAGKLMAAPDDVLIPTAANMGIIDENEMIIIRNAANARRDVIKVDAFPQDFASGIKEHDTEKNHKKASLSH